MYRRIGNKLLKHPSYTQRLNTAKLILNYHFIKKPDGCWNCYYVYRAEYPGEAWYCKLMPIQKRYQIEDVGNTTELGCCDMWANYIIHLLDEKKGK